VTHADWRRSASLDVVLLAEKRTAVDERLAAFGAPEPKQDHPQSCLLRSSQTVDADVRRPVDGNWFVT
jgi:hypothetical protein